MKKYYVGGNRGVIAFLTIWLFMCMIMFVPILSIASEGIVTLPFVLFLFVFIGIGIFALVTTVQGIKRKEYALSGKKALGKVTNVRLVNHKSVSYSITFQYTTEGGEQALAICNISFGMVQYFQVGRNIPIFVHGEYAYYDEKALMNASNEFHFKEEVKMVKQFVRCEYCNSKVDAESEKCPYCGAYLK